MKSNHTTLLALLDGGGGGGGGGRGHCTPQNFAIVKIRAEFGYNLVIRANNRFGRHFNFACQNMLSEMLGACISLKK